jgi:hypothetical protein
MYKEIQKIIRYFMLRTPYLLSHNQKKVPGYVLRYVKWVCTYSMRE